jgi:hypothetical protein
MNKISPVFQSLLLAQKKLSHMAHGGLFSSPECGKIGAEYSENNSMTDTPTNISTSPNFKIVQPQFGDNSHLLTDKVFLSATSGMADRAYARCFETEEERETIEKARKYNIPFNTDGLDLKEFISSCEFDDLMAEVEDYEDSIRKAKEFYVYWDFCKYNPYVDRRG